MNQVAELITKEVQEKSLKDTLIAAVDKFKPDTDEDAFSFEARKSFQKSILEALPDNVVDEMVRHIKYEALISKRENKEFNMESVMKGEFFENIVVAERSLNKNENEKPSEPVRELHQLLKRPPIQAMQAIGHFRKPDLIEIDEESPGNLLLEKMTEIKTHALTPNDVNQITQFRQGFQNFEEAVVKQKALRGMGFANIFPALEEHRVRFAANFQVELVLPRDVNRDNLINPDAFLKDEKRIKAAQDKLKNVKVVNSAFNKEELALLFRAFKPQVEKGLK